MKTIEVENLMFWMMDVTNNPGHMYSTTSIHESIDWFLTPFFSEQTRPKQSFGFRHRFVVTHEYAIVC